MRKLIAFVTFIVASLCNVQAQYVLDLGYDDGINRILISDLFTPQIEEQAIEDSVFEVLTLKSADGTVSIPFGCYFGWCLKNGQGELIAVGPFEPEGDLGFTYKLYPDNGKLVEKAREFDPFGHAGLTPLGIIRLTPSGKI